MHSDFDMWGLRPSETPSGGSAPCIPAGARLQTPLPRLYDLILDPTCEAL